MKFNITELLIVFDDMSPSLTNEELGEYWLTAKRKDNLTLMLYISVYEDKVDIVVSNNDHITITDIAMKNCSEIRVLDEKKRQLEILQNNSKRRCFISLDGKSLLSYRE